MKEKAIKKINTLGKIGRIVTNIGLVFAIIITVISILGTIGCACIPKNFVKFDISETTKTTETIDLNGVVKLIKVDSSNEEAVMDSLKSQLTQRAEVTQAKRDSKVTVTDDSVIVEMGNEKSHTLDIREVVIPFMVMVDFTLAFVIALLIFAGKSCKAFEKCESPFEDRVISSMRKFACSLIPWVIFNGITESTITSFLYGNLELNFNLDGSTIAVVLVILALTYVFKYGAILQKESDETL